MEFYRPHYLKFQSLLFEILCSMAAIALAWTYCEVVKSMSYRQYCMDFDLNWILLLSSLHHSDYDHLYSVSTFQVKYFKCCSVFQEEDLRAAKKLLSIFINKQTVDDFSLSYYFTSFGLWNVEEKLFILDMFFLNLTGLAI